MSEFDQLRCPVPMGLTDIHTAEPGEVRALVGSRALSKVRHVLIDLTRAEGAIELDLVGARDLHRWLGRWIQWRLKPSTRVARGDPK